MLALLAFLLGNTKNILIIAVGVASYLTRDGRGMNANFLCDTFFVSLLCKSKEITYLCSEFSCLAICKCKINYFPGKEQILSCFFALHLL